MVFSTESFSAFFPERRETERERREGGNRIIIGWVVLVGA